MSGLSPKLPLNVDSNDGAYGLNKTYKEMVQQNLKMLILTNPGERIMDPLFGVGLKTFLFEFNDPITYSKISAAIYEQVAKYLPFIQIIDIIIDGPITKPGLDANLASIELSYKILPLDIEDVLNIIEELPDAD